MRDLTNPFWIKLKGALFVVLGVLASGVLLAEARSWHTAMLLAVSIWAFCRAYYFAFYVLGHYVDPSFRFSGIGSALRYLRHPPAKRPAPSQSPRR